MDGNETTMWDGIFAEEAEETAAEVEEMETDGDGAQEAAVERAGTESSGGDPESIEIDGEEDSPSGDGFSPEMRAAIEVEAQRLTNAFIEKQFAGVANPFTGRPIRTEADLAAYREAFAAEQQRQQLQEMGVEKEQLDAYIQNHPAMRQAQQVIRQQEQQQANAFMAKEFDALKKEFPDCGLKSPEHLHGTEAGKRALQMWARTPGITLADAYAATHRAEISKRQNAAAKQAAMNEMNSKNHLRQTKGSNAKGDVPEEIYAAYKPYFPNASRAEIAEMYRKNKENE